MKKVVWTSAVAALAIVGLSATPAFAQPARHQKRAGVEKRVDRKFKRLDQNGNGLIERSEWTRNARVFDRLDRDHDGSLSPQEFRRLVKHAARRAAKRRR